jgi:hypothetical protein
MAKSSGVGGGFYVGGYDLSGDVGSLENAGSPRATQDVTGIGQSAMDRLLMLGTGEIGFKSFFNDAALQEHVILSALPTTDTQVVYAKGQAIGDVCAMLVAKQINYDASRNADGSLEFAITASSTSGLPLEWGVMLSAADDTHGSAGSSGSLDGSASSSAGAVGYLQIIDINTGTPTFKIEDSANNSDWAALITFAAVANGAEPSFERKTVSGTVNRYLRVTSTGTFNNAKFIIGIRRGESTDDVAYA